MQIVLAHIGTRPSSKDPFDVVASMYIERCSVHAQCQSESFRSTEAFFAWLDKQQRRTPAIVVLLDSRGRQMSSEDFAGWLRRQRDNGAQQVVFAVGPADGWSESERKRATLLLSLGPLHSLMRSRALLSPNRSIAHLQSSQATPITPATEVDCHRAILPTHSFKFERRALRAAREM
jgi:23S rRNA (pseudouridine1915-N3)-methyltransferase